MVDRFFVSYEDCNDSTLAPLKRITSSADLDL